MTEESNNTIKQSTRSFKKSDRKVKPPSGTFLNVAAIEALLSFMMSVKDGGGYDAIPIVDVRISDDEFEEGLSFRVSADDAAFLGMVLLATVADIKSAIDSGMNVPIPSKNGRSITDTIALLRTKIPDIEEVFGAEKKQE